MNSMDWGSFIYGIAATLIVLLLILGLCARFMPDEISELDRMHNQEVETRAKLYVVAGMSPKAARAHASQIMYQEALKTIKTIDNIIKNE